MAGAIPCHCSSEDLWGVFLWVAPRGGRAEITLTYVFLRLLACCWDRWLGVLAGGRICVALSADDVVLLHSREGSLWVGILVTRPAARRCG